MSDNILKIIFAAGFIVGVIVRTAMLVRKKRWWKNKEGISGVSGTVTDKLLLALVSFGMQVFPVIYYASAWLDFADYALPPLFNIIAAVLGIIVFAAAIWCLWKSHKDLGDNFAPELKVKNEHNLVTYGIYKYIRHPMYTSHLLWAIAQFLILRNWIAGPSFILTSIPLLVYRIPREEKMMMEKFGKEYEEYRKKTGRLVPVKR